MAALAVFAHVILAEGEIASKRFYELSALASAFVGLSLCANFAFGFVDSIALAAFFLWAAYRARNRWPAKLATSSFLPGIVVTFLICGSVLWNWPRGQLYWGARSVAEMWKAIVEPTFSELNPEFVNPSLLTCLEYLKPALPYAIVVLTIVLFVSASLQRSRLFDPRSRKLLSFAGLTSAIFLATLFVHWLAFRIAKIPLPMGRTGLFFVPLILLVLGSSLAIDLPRFKIASKAGLAGLLLCAVYFIGCLRLSYFHEWKYNADTKSVYWVVADLNRQCGTTDFVTSWHYVGALNFYRVSLSE